MLNPIKLGGWKPYRSYVDKEQIDLQRANFINTDVDIKEGCEIVFIYSDFLDSLNSGVIDLSKKCRVENTETVLEDEVYYTTKIEGAKTTRVRTSEIHNGSPVRNDNEYSELMVKNSFEATKYMNVYGNKIDNSILRGMWEILTDKVCENRDLAGIMYRSGDVEVGSFRPADYSDLDQLMEKWISFYNSSYLNDVPFIKAAILHYSFETIHPFCDGNGRAGRLLMNNYLIRNGIDSARAVSFSMFIDRNRGAYDTAFVDSENIFNDCTPFMEYMLSTFYDAYESALMIQQEKTEIKSNVQPDFGEKGFSM